jgi:hypothetical protein
MGPQEIQKVIDEKGALHIDTAFQVSYCGGAGLLQYVCDRSNTVAAYFWSECALTSSCWWLTIIDES